MTLLLLLAGLAFGQESSTMTATMPLEDELRLENVRKDVRDLQSGRPTITGVPNFQSGFRIANGAIVSTVPAASAAQVFVGSFTYNVAAYTPCAGSFGNCPNVCVPGSTLTYTATAGATTRFAVEGAQNSNGFPVQSILIDGVEVTTGKRFMRNEAATYSINYEWLITGIAAGAHSVCWAFWYTSGNSGGLLGPATTSNGFLFYEAH